MHDHDLAHGGGDVSIVVVDDEQAVRDLLALRMQQEGYRVRAFATAVDAIEAVRTEPPDLVLMDVGMPGMDGYDACRLIKAEFPQVPVLFVTAHGDVESTVAGFDAGGRDYIAKPFTAPELLARVRATLRERALLTMTARRAELLEQLAMIDDLALVANRRYLSVRLPEETERARRYQRDLSCLMVDVDDFKQINDRAGHAAGDQVIAMVAQTIASDLRSIDLVARYGGEEFVVILPETPIEGALVAGERIRAKVERTKAVDGSCVTVSVGAATGTDPEILVRADTAMYRAKRAGKNRVVAWEREMARKT